MHISFHFRVFKDLQEWKEAPSDCLILALYQLQAYYLNEIKRGMVGIGQYSLAPQFSGIQFEELCCNGLSFTSPEEIVKSICESFSNQTSDENSSQVFCVKRSIYNIYMDIMTIQIL